MFCFVCRVHSTTYIIILTSSFAQMLFLCVGVLSLEGNIASLIDPPHPLIYPSLCHSRLVMSSLCHVVYSDASWQVFNCKTVDSQAWQAVLMRRLSELWGWYGVTESSSVEPGCMQGSWRSVLAAPVYVILHIPRQKLCQGRLAQISWLISPFSPAWCITKLF